MKVCIIQFNNFTIGNWDKSEDHCREHLGKHFARKFACSNCNTSFTLSSVLFEETMSKDWSLGAECELRCEVKAKEVLILSLIEGTGEIFGVEMAANRKYCFHDENIAVFTWKGCKLRTEGNCEAIYTSHETPMVNVININAQLEARRDVALANADRGPRVSLH
jgi:hypothetical protein